MNGDGILIALNAIEPEALQRAGAVAVAPGLDPRQVLIDAGVEIPADATVTFEVSIEEEPGEFTAAGRPPKKRCTKWCVEVPRKASVCRTVCEWY